MDVFFFNFNLIIYYMFFYNGLLFLRCKNMKLKKKMNKKMNIIYYGIWNK